MIIIDVRDKDEYEEANIDNSINFDLLDLMNEKLPDINKDEEIILYCNSGGRSGRALCILEDAGFTNVQNGGGYFDLKNKGY